MRKFSKYDVRAIHLIRDVRGVVASRLRRGHFGEDAHKAARRWVKSHTSYQRVLKTVPEGNYMRVRYEDLCQDTQSTLQELYRFLGVDPDVRLTDLGASSHHIIGNPMRVRSLSEIRLDKRWESLLTEEQLAEIKQIAGKLSHQYGYD